MRKELAMNWYGSGRSKLSKHLVLLMMIMSGLVILGGHQPLSAACPTEMVSLWKLEEANSDNGYSDEIGNNNGVLHRAAPSQTSGRVGSAQAFAAGQGIVIPANQSIAIGAEDEFTIELWMRMAPAGTTQVIFGRRGPGSDRSQLWVGTGADDAARAYFRFSENVAASLAGTTPLSNGQWHHLALVREVNAANSESTLRLYVDGAEQANRTISHQGRTLNLSTSDITFASLNGDYQYVGSLDEVAFSEAALAPTVISAHYQNGAAGYCEQTSEVTITSTPVTTASVNAPYSYQVTATGNPAPTFTLVQRPNGMNITPEGLISWTPTQEGSFPVQVRATSGSTSATQDFTIVVAENQAPTANAGADQNVVEGAGVRLDGEASSDEDGEIATYEWEQISGPDVILSNPSAQSPTFVAPAVNGEDLELVFRLTVTDNGGKTATDTVTVTVTDNGISGFDEGVVTFRSVNDEEMGIRTDENSDLVYLAAKDPAEISNRTNRPTDMVYGLIEFVVRVANPGDTAQVTVLLPEPASEEHEWFKYIEGSGWENYSEHAEFNEDRTEVTLTLQDGGFGDADGEENGLIVDPSGLGIASSGGGGGSSGGCMLNPMGAVGLEWLLLLLSPAVVRMGIRIRRR
jgi:hypothetical protein